uniref:Uncharacterized protein n=1 Tax=Oreochromis aureus TaxID=47969 RepID=A0AAZ1XMF2_OREAU
MSLLRESSVQALGLGRWGGGSSRVISSLIRRRRIGGYSSSALAEGDGRRMTRAEMNEVRDREWGEIENDNPQHLPGIYR